MAKAITAPDVWMDKQIVDLLKSAVATFSQTKLASGGNPSSFTFADAEKLLVRRAMAKNRRGNQGFRTDISSAGQVP